MEPIYGQQDWQARILLSTPVHKSPVTGPRDFPREALVPSRNWTNNWRKC